MSNRSAELWLLSPLSAGVDLPLYCERGWVQVGLGLWSIVFVRQGAAEPCCGIGGPQFRHGVGEAVGRHLALLMLLTLDRQRLSATVQPPPGEPSQGFPGDEGALTWGLMSGPWSPLRP